MFGTQIVFLKEFFEKVDYEKKQQMTKKHEHIQTFKWALLFLFFPTFLICSYFSLLFHENALLFLLFHSKMSFMRKNPEIFPPSLGFYKLTEHTA